MAQLPERLHSTAFILRAPGSLGHRGAAQFGDDLRDRIRAGIDGTRAGHTAEAAITGAGAPVKIQLRQGNPFLFEVFPDIQLGPVEQRVDARMSSGGKRRLVLIPQFSGEAIAILNSSGISSPVSMCTRGNGT